MFIAVIDVGVHLLSFNFEERFSSDFLVLILNDADELVLPFF